MENNSVKSDKQVIDEVPDLSLDIWQDNIFKYLTENDIIVFSSVCKKFQWVVQQIKSSFFLEHNYHLITDCFLNYALSTSCSSVNINHCYWLKPSKLLQTISRTKLQHFHIINCNVNEDVMRAITSLKLESFSFTYAKEWSDYFREHSAKSTVFQEGLVTLKILIKDGMCDSANSTTVLNDVYEKVLQYCIELQDLMMTSSQKNYMSLMETLPNPITKHSTSIMPKLKSLVIHIDLSYLLQDVVDLFKAFLLNKVIPLEHVDFGSFNCYLLKKNILHHSSILPWKKTLSLKNYDDNSLYKLGDFLDNKWLMRQNNYKKIYLESIEINFFVNFADKIISSSGKSLEKLYLRNCKPLGYSVLEMFAVNCVQITHLDLTIVDWLEGSRRHGRRPRFPIKECPLYQAEELEKNEALMEVLTNFKNLTNFFISPLMLQCIYHTRWPDYEMFIKEIPFWKVTQACRHLRELHIRWPLRHYLFASIHENSLYDIAHCTNLKVLVLGNFDIRINSEFLLSRITKGCPQLEELTIRWNHCWRGLQSYDNSFNLLKHLKKLRVGHDLKRLSAAVIDDLSQCKYLEKLELAINGDEDVQPLISALLKFEHLYLLSIKMLCSDKMFETLCSALQKIHDKRPAFFGVVHGSHPKDTFKTLNCSLNVEDYIKR